MARFIINRQEYDGHHEVHDTSKHCESSTYPEPQNQIDLGYHNSCREAINWAESQLPNWAVDGCAFCTACHTR